VWCVYVVCEYVCVLCVCDCWVLNGGVFALCDMCGMFFVFVSDWFCVCSL